MKISFFKKIKLHKLHCAILGVFLLTTFFFGSKVAEAAIIAPGGNITACNSTLAAVGTYYLTANIVTANASCIVISSPGVVITTSVGSLIVRNLGANAGINAATTTTGMTGYSFTVDGFVTISSDINTSGPAGDGTVTFQSNSKYAAGKTITGGAIFKNNAYNLGTTTDNAVFNDASFNQGKVVGNATFTNTVYSWNATSSAIVPQLGTVSGTTNFVPTSGSTVTFNVGTASTTNACSSAQCTWSTNVSSYVFGTSTPITPTWNFYGNSFLATSTTLSGNTINLMDSSYNPGTIIASTTTFGGSSFNFGTITATTISFNGGSYNVGNINGNPTFNLNSYNDGSVNGNATFNNNSYNSSASNVSASNISGLTLAPNASGSKLFTVFADTVSLWNYPFSTSSVLLVKNWYRFDSTLTSNAAGDKIAAAGYYGNTTPDYIYTSSAPFTSWATSTSAGQHYWKSLASNSAGDELAAADGGFGAGYIYTSSAPFTTWTAATSTGAHNWTSITLNAAGDKLFAVDGNYVYYSTSPFTSWVTLSGAGQHLWSSIATNAAGDKIVAVDGSIPYAKIYTSSAPFTTWTSPNLSGSQSNYGWTSVTSDSTGLKLAVSDRFNQNVYTTSDAFKTWATTTITSSDNYVVASNADASRLFVSGFSGGAFITKGYVGGNATFNGSSYNSGVVTGNATFTNTAYSWNATTTSVVPQVGTVSGTTNFVPTSGSTVIFNVGTASTTNACSSAQCIWNSDTSTYNFGSYTPIWNFYGNSIVATSTTLSGNTINLMDTSYNPGTIIASTTTFGGSSFNFGTTTATTLSFNGGSYNVGTTTASSATFYANSYNANYFVGNPTFSGNSYNTGTVSGNATFNSTYYDSVAPVAHTFTVSGSKAWKGQVTGTINGSDSQAITGFAFSGSSHNDTTITASSTFSGSSYNNGNINSSVNTTFTGSSYNAGTITHDATFNGSSYNTNTISGNAKFNSLYYDTASSTVPTSGIFKISGSSIWSGQVAGSVLGSDSAVITDFVFKGASHNEGTITSNNAEFRESSYNNGTVNATVDVYYPSQYLIGGVVVGTTTYHNYSVGVYFNDAAPGAAGDGDWNNINNWWVDSAYSVHAQVLPNVSSTVYVVSPVTQNLGSTILVNIVRFSNGSRLGSGVNIHASGGAYFDDTSYNAGGTITGNATFTNTTYSWNSTRNSIRPQLGSVTGTTYYIPITGSTVTFNIGTASTTNACSGGQCVWNSNILNYNFGTSTTPIWNFYGNSLLNSNINLATSSINFFDNSYNQDIIIGNPIFNGSSYNNGYGNITGNPTFNGSSYNGGNITGNATFNGSSYNTANITGNATFTSTAYSWNSSLSSFIPQGGIVSGTTNFIPTSGTTVAFNIGTASTNNACSSARCIWNTDVSSYVFGTSTPITPVWNFYGNSIVATSTVLSSSNVNFFDHSYNPGTIIASSTIFNDNSYNVGIVNGTAKFATTHYNSSAPVGGVFYLSGGSTWQGNVNGTTTGSDDVSIKDFLFASTTSNVGTIGSSTAAYFWLGSLNSATVSRPFKVQVSSGKIWDNASGDGVWINPANWIGGVVPITHDNIVLAASVNLPSNLSNNMYVVGNNVIIDGTNPSGDQFTINGNVIGDGINRINNGGGVLVANATNALGFTLKNVTVTGQVSSNGGSDSGDGGGIIYSVGSTPVNNGSGYQVGDVLTLSGAGNDATVRINSVTPGTGAVISASTNRGGAGYEVGDNLTVVGGNSNATIRVDSTDAGPRGVTDYSINNPGTGYVSGETVNINGGDNSAQIYVQSTDGVGTINDYSIDGNGYDFCPGDFVAVSGGDGNAYGVVGDTDGGYDGNCGSLFDFSDFYGGSSYQESYYAGEYSFYDYYTGDYGYLYASSVIPDNGTGAVTNSYLINSGSDYSVGSGTETFGGSGTGLTVDVNAVDGGYGAVTSWTLTSPGNGYPAGTDVSTSGGSGSGFTVDLDSVDGDSGTTVSLLTSGTGYSAGTYNTTGGSGLGARISVTSTASLGAGGVGASGGSISLANVFAGTVSANGGVGGGNGGPISIATSSTSVITTNGGSSFKNGGNGGNVNITNSYATASSTAVTSNGGSSTTCGVGGSSGTITITDSSDYVPGGVVGTAATASCSGGVSQGTSHTQTVVGVYTPPKPNNTPVVTNPVPTPSSSSGNSFNFNILQRLLNPLSLPALPQVTVPISSLAGTTNVPNPLEGLKTPGPLNLTPLPRTVFTNGLQKFLFEPADLAVLKNAPEIKNYLAAAIGLTTTQSIVSLLSKPLALNIPTKTSDIPSGLVLLSVNGTPVQLKIAYDSKNTLVEQATVLTGSKMEISVYPILKGDASVSFNNNDYQLRKVGSGSLLSTTIGAPFAPGIYTLSVTGAPMPIMVNVVSSVASTNFNQSTNKKSFWSFLKLW